MQPRQIAAGLEDINSQFEWQAWVHDSVRSVRGRRRALVFCVQGTRLPERVVRAVRTHVCLNFENLAYCGDSTS